MIRDARDRGSRFSEAEAERLRSTEAEIAISDVEAELFEQLTRIRAAVAGEVTDAAGVAAVRSALLRLFDGFTLRRDIPDRAHVELIDTRWIEPLVSEKAVAGYARSYGRCSLANRLSKRQTITPRSCSCSSSR